MICSCEPTISVELGISDATSEGWPDASIPLKIVLASARSAFPSLSSVAGSAPAEAAAEAASPVRSRVPPSDGVDADVEFGREHLEELGVEEAKNCFDSGQFVGKCFRGAEWQVAGVDGIDERLARCDKVAGGVRKLLIGIDELGAVLQSLREPVLLGLELRHQFALTLEARHEFCGRRQ